MAIVRFGVGAAELERGSGVKGAKKSAKKAAKHPAKKHADKHAAKHAAKHAEKHAAKHAADLVLDGVEGGGSPGEAGEELAKSFHHLQRTGAVLSLLEPASGGDLRALFELGVEQYRAASERKAKKHIARAAQGILRATEHLAMAALYSARLRQLIPVAVPKTGKNEKELRKLRSRLEKLRVGDDEGTKRLQAMTGELLRRAEGAGDDVHLEHELTKAVDGLCSALEEGL